MTHTVDAYVGSRIRHRRWVAGLTQQQLANSVGIKFQQIQKYETGMNRVSASRLWEIAATLNVPVSFFFDGLSQQEGPADQATGKDVMADREAVQLVRAYYAIPEPQRRQIFELAKVLSEAN